MNVLPMGAGVKVWLATGHTDMRCGFPSLALRVQEVLKQEPLGGHLFCFRGRRGDLIKLIWHDGQGACLFTKKLERGRFIWPNVEGGAVAITPAQLSYLLSGIDWRNPQETWRPTRVKRSFIIEIVEELCFYHGMPLPPLSLPIDLASAHAALLAEREARLRAEAEASSAKAKLSGIEALNAHLQLLIAKLERDKHGPSRERTQRLIDQMELQLEELVADATEDELASEKASAKTQSVRAFTRKRPVRKPWPENIERERIVVKAPTVCDHCGSKRLSKLGEDTTETLEEIPRHFKVVETVREKFTCRDCGCISQAPAPFHATPRGFLGPNLLSTIVFDKFSEHQPLNRQSRRFRSEGIDLSTQTLADQVGYVSAAVRPLFDMIETHVFAAERLHGDDTTIPILAKGQCTTGRIWTYVCDDRPFGGQSPPAAVFYASSDRRGEHPQKHLAEFKGILQADCYNGFNPLFDRTRKQMPVTPAFCFAHARRKFFELADVSRSARRGKGLRPVSAAALEAVRRIDALFDIERNINGKSAEERLAVRQEKSKPLLIELEAWFRLELEGLSRSSPVIEPINYMLSRWVDFARYADDGRVCMTNNAAERALRGVACGRKNWSFAGSQRGADRAAIMLTLITTARLNDVDPKAWLADVLARIADLSISRLHELLPWHWKAIRARATAAAV